MEKTADYQVRLPFFEGTLDLLLYLIRNKEMEIEEISISLITGDYYRLGRAVPPGKPHLYR